MLSGPESKIIADQRSNLGCRSAYTTYFIQNIYSSKLDYSAIVYVSVRKSYLKILEPVANQALRLCLGAYRTSPVSNLQVLAHEPPLELRREQLSLQYCRKLNPTHKTISQPYSTLYRNKPHAIPYLELRIQTDLQHKYKSNKFCYCIIILVLLYLGY